MSFSGDIPLPPNNTSVTGHVQPQAIPLPTQVPGIQANPGAGQAYPYDVNTMAYYQAYYAQMAAAGYSFPGYPAAAPQVPYLNTGIPSVAPLPVVNASSNLHPLLQHQSNSVAQSSDFSHQNNQGKKHETVDTSVVEEEDDDPTIDRGSQNKRNVLPIHGNEKTMNLNTLLLTNIQQSQYFKTTLYGLKTINELLDEIWYNVKHMEPWERGSRKVSVLT